ncbi:MAG: hypothetical protein BWY27_00609 [Bacteroidetes bacterium ADurb.Bin234]|nr:MAG: hypothetical protein BWY27_00609 [Bacteroidetes bacterium ADurb.Bin234]
MKTRKLIICCLLCLFIGFKGYAQQDNVSYYKAPLSNDSLKIKKNNWLYNLSTGGNLGLQFGTYTYIEVSPHVAYHFNEWVSAGVGLSYSFLNFDRGSHHIVGGSVFSEFYFLKYLALHAEYMILNYDDFFTNQPIDSKRLTSNNLLLGGGFYQRINASYAIYFMAFYNITDQPEKNFLISPVFKMGVSFWPKYL